MLPSKGREKCQGTECSPDKGSGSAKDVMDTPKQPRKSRRPGRIEMSLYPPGTKAVFI